MVEKCLYKYCKYECLHCINFPFHVRLHAWGRMGHKRPKKRQNNDNNRDKTRTKQNNHHNFERHRDKNNNRDKQRQNWTTTETTSKGVNPRSRPVVASSGSSPRLSGSCRRWARGQVYRLRLFSLRAAWRRRWKGAPIHSGTSFGFGLCRGFGGDRRGMSIKDRVVDERFQRLPHPLRGRQLDEPFQQHTHSQTTSSFV